MQFQSIQCIMLCVCRFPEKVEDQKPEKKHGDIAWLDNVSVIAKWRRISCHVINLGCLSTFSWCMFFKGPFITTCGFPVEHVEVMQRWGICPSVILIVLKWLQFLSIVPVITEQCNWYSHYCSYCSSAGCPSFAMCATSTHGQRMGMWCGAVIFHWVQSSDGRRCGWRETLLPSGHWLHLSRTIDFSRTLNKWGSSSILVRNCNFAVMMQISTVDVHVLSCCHTQVSLRCSTVLFWSTCLSASTSRTWGWRRELILPLWSIMRIL